MRITTPVIYRDQTIPSTPNISYYELMLTTLSYVFVMNKDIDNNNNATNNMPKININFTGTRVKQYAKHLRVINEFKAQWIFLSKYLDYKARLQVYQNNKDNALFIYAALNKCKSNDDLYQRASKWQAETCRLQKVNNHKAKIISLPAVKDDETILIRTGDIIIKSLLLTEMIKKKNIIVSSDTLFENNEELNSKLLVLFGDGLSYEHFRNAKDNLLKKTLSFANDYKHTRIILNVLEYVVMLSRDLHGCCYMLGSVHKLFCGGLIQPI